jgi:tetratricopeptide (TPR) repeat protein
MASAFQFRVLFLLRLAVAGACCWAIWSSWLSARADFLFHLDTEASIRSAIRLVPDGWEYYMRLAQFDQAHAQDDLETSLHLNPYDAQADIELGLQFEADGDYARAEKQLLEAYNVDHTYLPRWSLANYYFRRDNIPAFWHWARSAAYMPSDDIASLLDLCWRVSPDPATLTRALLNEKPEFLRQYMSFLLGRDQPAAVAAIAPHLVRAGDPQSDLGLFLSVINQLITRNDSAAANAVWNLLVAQKWAFADKTIPNNASFGRAPLAVGFDWSLPEYPGLHSWPGPAGLETEFTGTEPEDCVIAEQAVTLAPGRYAMSYVYRTSDISPDTGIRWQIFNPVSKTLLAESPDLSSNDLKYSSFGFIVPPDVPLLRLRLYYKRTIGTTHVSGSLDVQSTQIQSLPIS